MLTLIIEWNWDIVGTLTTVVGFVITLLTVAFFAGKLAQKITTNADNIVKIDEKIDKSVERLDDKIDKHIKESSEIHIEISKRLGRIEGYLGLGGKLIFDKSPLALSERGEKVVEGIDAQAAVDEVWDKILKEIANRKITKDSNGYDIQEACFDIGSDYMKLINEARQEATKNYALKEGYKIFEFGGVYAILIRDRYFKENGIIIKPKENDDL